MPARWTSRAQDSLGAAFTERLGYKAAALFFAVALWVVASGWRRWRTSSTCCS